MRKRDTVRNINRLTALMDAEILVGYSKYKGYAKPSSICLVKFENCLDKSFERSMQGAGCFGWIGSTI